jgi:carbon-monoxide dehydrogenase medium subunit
VAAVRHLRPGSLGAVAAAAREHDEDAKLVSGGTAVVLMIQQGLIAPSVLISLDGLTDVPGWREVSPTADGVRIGGGVRLAAVARSGAVQEVAPAMATAAGLVGNARIRNAATMGGNVAEADYASDPPAVLVALGARIEVSDGEAVRTVPAGDMFLDYFTTDLRTGEVVTAVELPSPAPGSRSSYTKYCSRSAEDRPCVGVATSLRAEDGVLTALDVVIGAVAGTPQRWPEVTASVLGRPFEEAAAAAVADGYADLVDPLDDARGSEWYRREMIRVLVRRSLLELAGTGEETR